MRSFKRIFAVIVSFLLSLVLFGLLVLEPFYHSEYVYYNDASLRKELSGTLDYLFIGASDGLCAFVPQVADEYMSVNSYNLSNTLMTWYERKELLKKEISRNPVKTVIIEISYNTFSRPYHEVLADRIALSRSESISERVRYTIRHIPFYTLDEVIGYNMADSVSYANASVNNLLGRWVSAFPQSPTHNVDYSSKGYRKKEKGNTIKFETTSQDIAQLRRNAEPIDTSINKKSLKDLYDIVDFCKEKGVSVQLVVVPISDSMIFSYTDWDTQNGQFKQIAQDLNCELYDFNLLKNRFRIFSDRASFFDEIHMSDDGARVFTKVYSEIMNRVSGGEDVYQLFFTSYSQMMEASPWSDML